MTIPFRRKGERKPTTVFRIMIWALIITSLLGALRFFEPVEDLIRGGRNFLRTRPADAKVLVVGIDDKTIQKLGSARYSRANDARLVEQLFAQGVDRIYYDMTFSEPVESAGDAAFANTLRQHRGKLFIGAMNYTDERTGKDSFIFPSTDFLSEASLISLSGYITPFGFSAEFPYQHKYQNDLYTSMSASIAGKKGEGQYRPDYAIDPTTVPYISFVDVLNGSGNAIDFHGKTVIVAPIAPRLKDIHHLAGRGWIPGVYYHVMGAQTLREGNPQSWGWIPALFAAFVLALVYARSQTRNQRSRVIALTIMLGVTAPFILDAFFITADFLPALLCFGIIAFRISALRSVIEASHKNASSRLPNLSAFREERNLEASPIIAMRVRNYAPILASFDSSVESEFVHSLVRRITAADPKTQLYHAEDTLYWLAPVSARRELEDHVEGLVSLLQAPVQLNDRHVDVQVAFGLCSDFGRPFSGRLASALHAADQAASENRPWKHYVGQEQSEAEWELSLMGELDHAVDAGQIWVAFQPQVDVSDGQIVGAEALVRWEHPVRGPIAPDKFVLAAERNNRIGKMTHFVMTRALAAIEQIIADNPAFRLSINISATLLSEPHFAKRTIEMIGASTLVPDNVTLEITETARVLDDPNAIQTLRTLADARFHISIDDYGTGNATLEYLSAIPFDEIKIDRRFVENLKESGKDLVMVNSTIRMAQSLGRRVVAEGVEDEATLSLLADLGCDVAQGFLIGKPMPFGDFATLITQQEKMQAFR